MLSSLSISAAVRQGKVQQEAAPVKLLPAAQGQVFPILFRISCALLSNFFFFFFFFHPSFHCLSPSLSSLLGIPSLAVGSAKPGNGRGDASLELLPPPSHCSCSLLLCTFCGFCGFCPWQPFSSCGGSPQSVTSPSSHSSFFSVAQQPTCPVAHWSGPIVARSLTQYVCRGLSSCSVAGVFVSLVCRFTLQWHASFCWIYFPDGRWLSTRAVPSFPGAGHGGVCLALWLYVPYHFPALSL